MNKPSKKQGEAGGKVMKRHMPEDSRLHIHLRENLNSYIIFYAYLILFISKP
jgi:hypothetical protein